jgi:uncharacterized protein
MKTARAHLVFASLLFFGGFFSTAQETGEVAVVGQDQVRLKAEQGDSGAQFKLGWCYAHGDGVLQDYAAAERWYRKAAEQGHAAAQFNLGWYCAQGLVVEQNLEEAVGWYRKAAVQGNADAQVALGMAYALGHGVEADAAQAVQWYRKAAEQGDAGAQFNLGLLLMEGQGVQRSDLDAYVWLSLAAAQGADTAAQTRDRVAERLSTDEQSEGQRRVMAFEAKPTVPVDQTERVSDP